MDMAFVSLVLTCIVILFTTQQWSSRCSENFSLTEEIMEELMDCGYFCRCLMDEVTPGKTSEKTVKVKQ